MNRALEKPEETLTILEESTAKGQKKKKKKERNKKRKTRATELEMRRIKRRGILI